jgi:hypothetical protein
MKRRILYFFTGEYCMKINSDFGQESISLIILFKFLGRDLIRKLKILGGNTVQIIFIPGQEFCLNIKMSRCLKLKEADLSIHVVAKRLDACYMAYTAQ